MITYSFTKHADRDLRKLPEDVQKRIVEKIKFYISTDQPLRFADKVEGEGGKVYRFRIGDYRVIFDWLDHHIKILKVRLKQPGAYH